MYNFAANLLCYCFSIQRWIWFSPYPPMFMFMFMFTTKREVVRAIAIGIHLVRGNHNIFVQLNLMETSNLQIYMSEFLCFSFSSCYFVYLAGRMVISRIWKQSRGYTFTSQILLWYQIYKVIIF